MELDGAEAGADPERLRGARRVGGEQLRAGRERPHLVLVGRLHLERGRDAREERVAATRRGEGAADGPELAPAGVPPDRAAVGLGEQLVPEADAEHRHAALRGLAEPRTGAPIQAARSPTERGEPVATIPSARRSSAGSGAPAWTAITRTRTPVGASARRNQRS